MRLLSIMGMLLVLTTRTLPAQAPVPQTSSPTVDWTKVNQEAIGKLAEYIRINTSNPPGNEIDSAKWFAQVFQTDIIPQQPSRVLLCDCIEERGEELFAAVCERDLEGIVAKWKRGKYVNDRSTPG